VSGATPGQFAPKRWALIALAVIGAGLIAAPAIFQMWHRAPLGAEMIKEFAPYMSNARLDGYERHIRDIDTGVREGDTKVAAALLGTGADAHRRFEARYPEFAGFQKEWSGVIHADMSDLLDRIHGNLGNYLAVKALPSFKLFPWFFVIPGIFVLVALGAARFLQPSSWGSIRWVLVALGVGLVLAPAVFQMFERAPKGGRMMTAFKTIETRKKVETIQGYFGSIAVGQGAARLELIPALQRSGLTRKEIADRFPGVSEFDRRWPTMLGDLTPMIGTMSDNVDNYQAVKALPPFPLFPWFFVAPGLLIVGLTLAATPRGAARAIVGSTPQPERSA
jgi:hypothetical protein